jgi:hypothetical protein
MADMQVLISSQNIVDKMPKIPLVDKAHNMVPEKSGRNGVSILLCGRSLAHAVQLKWISSLRCWIVLHTHTILNLSA